MPPYRYQSHCLVCRRRWGVHSRTATGEEETIALQLLSGLVEEYATPSESIQRTPSLSIFGSRDIFRYNRDLFQNPELLPDFFCRFWISLIIRQGESDILRQTFLKEEGRFSLLSGFSNYWYYRILSSIELQNPGMQLGVYGRRAPELRLRY